MTTEIKYQTKEEALAAVTKDGAELRFCSKKLKNNKEVVIAAIKNDSWSFKYTSDDIKSSKAFILKAINEGISSRGLVKHANVTIQSDIEVLTLAVEKSDDGWPFFYAKGEAAMNKELAAKALVKWGAIFNGKQINSTWVCLHPTIQEFFPKECWYEKAQAYLYHIEQEKQAELVSGGCTEEDEVVW